jgi:hypothetical protein
MPDRVVTGNVGYLDANQVVCCYEAVGYPLIMSLKLSHVFDQAEKQPHLVLNAGKHFTGTYRLMRYQSS